MPKPIKIAVVGLGSVAQRGVLPHLSQPDIGDRVKLQAVMDTVVERAKASAEKFGAAEWYSDYDELLKKADIDAVTLSSPIFLHYEQSLKAIQAGKHVHSNKPITMTTAEASRLVEESAKTGVKVVACPGNSPITPAATRMRQLLKEKAIGDVYFAVAAGGHPGHEFEEIRQKDDVLSAIDPAWYYTTQGPPLTVSSNTVYQLHTLVSLLGSVKRVTGFSDVVVKERTLLKPGPGPASTWKGTKVTVVNDDNTLLVCDFGNSVLAYVVGTYSCRDEFPSFYISGTHGTLVEAGRELRIHKRDQPFGPTELITEKPTEPKLPYVSGVHEKLPESHVYNDVMHLVDCVINDKPPIVYDNVLSLMIARHVIEIGEKGWIAARTGQTQTLTTSLWY